MAWDEAHKAQSRNRILSSAGALFTASGYDGVSIDEVMKHAGLTRGAFYAHFKSKSELYAHAIMKGADRARKVIVQESNGQIEHLAEHYLRIGAADAKLDYCPLAFLVTDICHREPQVKATYEKVLKGFQGVIAEHGLNESQAIQVSIMMVGGLALSRATDNEALRDDILAASFAGVKTIAAQCSATLPADAEAVNQGELG